MNAVAYALGTFVASFTILPLFFAGLWVVGIPFGTLRIWPTYNGLVLTSSTFALVVGAINALQGASIGVGCVIGSIAAILAWRQIRDRYL